MISLFNILRSVDANAMFYCHERKSFLNLGHCKRHAYLWKYTAKPARQAARSSRFVVGGDSVDFISKTGMTKTTPVLGGRW